MFWGGLSDRVGRKPILLVGCSGTILSMIMVGFATNIWVALAGRAIGGILNGNIGVIQTMVGELVKKPEHERKSTINTTRASLTATARAYSVMPFVWSIGTIIGPAIGGTFAEPSQSYPNTFSKDGIFGRFPYLLPNLMCAGLLLVSMILGWFLLEETHPDMQPQVVLPHPPANISEESPLVAVADAIKHPITDLRSDAYGTFEESVEHEWDVQHPRVKPPKIFSTQVVALIVALGLFTYHSMSYDHLLPIFLEDEGSEISMQSFMAVSSPGAKTLEVSAAGGLGLSVQTVGIIMSVNGIIALLIQVFVFPPAALYVGVHNVFIIVTVLGPIVYVMIPLIAHLPEPLLFPGLYFCLTVRNLLHILAYPVLLIMIKEATPSPSVLGKVNGLAASAGAACRTISPPIAGALYTIGARIGLPGLAWYGSAIVAGVGAVQCFTVKRTKQLVDDVPVFANRERSKEASSGPLVDEINAHLG